MQSHPSVISAYEQLAASCRDAGPLTPRDIALVKVAVSIGRGSSRSVHAHARKALQEGIEAAALRHLALMALPTIGLPAALDALKWVDECCAEQSVAQAGQHPGDGR
ncbi:MAG: carboxymuconolactone decarboxylase family protein [Vicinamibacterales bacterium]